MTMRMSADDQFKFLLSCVKWSNNGKVDFQEVASECGVVSKGAAAKRYERMLKNHGIHPNGGPLDNPTPPREKGVTTPKVSKKRKCEDMTESIKQDEDDKRKPLVVKRPRNEQHREIKQELPQMTYPPPPYIFHPMMPAQGPYQHRPMPPYMHGGMPHGQPHFMQHLPHPSQPPYQMMPGTHNNHQFMMPLHQMQPFSINQNIPPPVQDSNGLGSFDDFCNQDFSNASFESLLNNGPTGAHIPNEALQSETPSAPQDPQQTSMDPQPEDVSSQIKVEPCQLLNSSFHDTELTKELAAVSQLTKESPNDPPIMPTTIESNGPAAVSTPIEAEHHPATIETTLPFKQENDGNCIFISD